MTDIIANTTPTSGKTDDNEGKRQEKHVPLFEQSSQNRHWLFSSDDLQNKRMKVLEKSVEDLKSNEKFTKIDEKDVVIPNLNQVLLLLRLTELKIIEYARLLKLDRIIQATAFMFFKRFFINHSIFNYDPLKFAIVSLFLSVKVESSHVSLNVFVDKIKKRIIVENNKLTEKDNKDIKDMTAESQSTVSSNLSSNESLNTNSNTSDLNNAVPKNGIRLESIPTESEMINLEFELSKGIRFEYMIHHSFWPLHGFYLDIQAFIIEKHQGDNNLQTKSFQLLQKLYQKSDQLCTIVSLSDLILYYNPSNIALATLLISAKQFKCMNMLEDYLNHRLIDYKLNKDTDDNKDNENNIEDKENRIQQKKKLLEKLDVISKDIEKIESLSIKKSDIEKNNNLRNFCTRLYYD